MSLAWFKFYPTDWRSDPSLRMCTLGARGLWIEMIALMHEAEPYGHLLVSGHFPTDAQLAVLAGTSPEQIPDYIGELESAGVFSRTRKGVIYSRKMTRISKKAAIARNNGKTGGNPSLCKGGENSSSVNPRDKGGDKPQKPEARSQKEKEVDKSTSKKKSCLTAEKCWRILSEVCSEPVAKDFVEYRKAIGKAMTCRAAELMRDMLSDHHVPDEVLNASIRNGWTGIFPDKLTGSTQNQSMDHDRARWREIAERNAG